MVIIGISGKKGSGKDTLADSLVKVIGERLPKTAVVAKAAFADALKVSLTDYIVRIEGEQHSRGFWVGAESRFAFYKEEFNHPEKKKRWRHILQFWGGELHRGIFGDDYWIKQFIREITSMEETVKDQYGESTELFVLVPDLRYKNELAALIDRGAYLVRVNKKLTFFQRLKERLFGDRHLSETDLDNETSRFDFVFENDHTKGTIVVRDAANKIMRNFTRKLPVDETGSPEVETSTEPSAS